MKLFSVQELAEKLGKSESMIKKYIKDKKLKATRFGGRKWVITEAEAKKIKK